MLCAAKASAIWSPTRITGLSEVIGSWKTIADIAPAHVAHGRLVEGQEVRGAEHDPPDRADIPRGRRPMTAGPSIDLPEPDSPTTQSVSPGATVRQRSLTASARSARSGSDRDSRSIDRRGAALMPHHACRRPLRNPGRAAADRRQRAANVGKDAAAIGAPTHRLGDQNDGGRAASGGGLHANKKMQEMLLPGWQCQDGSGRGLL